VHCAVQRTAAVQVRAGELQEIADGVLDPVAAGLSEADGDTVPAIAKLERVDFTGDIVQKICRPS
jgi:hypothetical protein